MPVQQPRISISGQTTPVAVHTGSEVELQQLRKPSFEAAPEAEDGTSITPGAEAVSLPPMDGGKQAWLFLAACFFLEGLVWGFPFAFGVFQKYYSTNAPFAGSSNIAVIGTCAMGIMYLLNPVILAGLRAFPHSGRWAPLAGLLIMCVSLAGSSFSTTVTHLIATQGVIYAIGGSIAYCPCILYMDEWFARRKGLAYGIMWSGTGLAGVLIPLLLEAILDAQGFRTALRVWSGMLFALTAPLCYFIKPRLPIASAAGRRWKPGLSFLLRRPFMLHQLANVVQAMGFFLPGVYLPSFAQLHLDASPYLAALTIILLNAASVFGCVVMGTFVDRFHVTTCIQISTVGAALGAFLLWGLSSSLPTLYVFSAIYGFCAGSFTTTWPGIVKNVEGSEKGGPRGTDPVMVVGCLSAGRGIGNIVSGPLSEALVKGLPWKGHAAGGYGSGHGAVIIFTGVTALLGGASIVWRRLGWLA